MPALTLIDLAFGDSGKGTVIDYLARRHAAHTVVRFNGGPQAAHNVVAPDGSHHTFSQFGSGTFAGARTLLSRYMLVEPYALLNEEQHLIDLGLPDAADGLMIDARAVVITPFHQAANRLRELARARAGGAHGTCGMGIGETMQDHLDRPDLTLYAGDLAHPDRVGARLRAVHEYKLQQLPRITGVSPVQTAPHAENPPNELEAGYARALQTLLTPDWLDAALHNYAELARRARILSPKDVRAVLLRRGTLLLEAAQGVLLDEWHGFHPHTTWSTTTFANAQALLDEADYTGPRAGWGVLRTYFTRHGHGPFVTEDPALRASLPEPHNDGAGWQGAFRVGPMDLVAARYALEVAGRVDALAITHFDRLADLPPKLCTAYDILTRVDPAIDHRITRNDNGDVTALRPLTPPDLAQQEHLTQALFRARPVYRDLPDLAPDRFLHTLSRELGASISLTSSGPTADDKEEQSCPSPVATRA